MLGKAIDKMKSFKNLYTKLLDKEFITECIYKASRGKRKHRDVKRVLNNVPHYVEVIYEMLDTDSFEQKPHRVREITERGKTRIIVIPHFIESIVHYMVIEILKPIFMNRFSNFSCRRTIYRVHRKQRKTIYDARRSLSALGWLKQAQMHKYFERHIYSFTNPKQLRTIISNYDRRHVA
jgi:hypothetical protein